VIQPKDLDGGTAKHPFQRRMVLGTMGGVIIGLFGGALVAAW
jgi:hypothetical protein